MTDAATPPTAARRSPRSGGAIERSSAFDEFYKDSRDRLLVQTVALTGDLTAARSAVRDAYVVAWHHWRKITRQGDPENVVRGYAYRFGLRRRSARPFARRKDGDDSARETLEALAGISLTQRKAVILTQLAGVDMPQAAREIGVPLDSAERELAAGAALFAHDRGINTGHIHDTLVGLESMTRSISWPRPSIIRRAGSARRRAHTLIGAAAAVAVFGAAGAIVTDTTGLRPLLDREARVKAAAHTEGGPREVNLPETALLTADPLVKRLHDKGWILDGTTDNSAGNGLAQPCQNTRYADPRGAAAYVRRFHVGTGAHARAYVQSVEASNNLAAAQRAYKNALAWFTACEPPAGRTSATLPQVHLVSTATTAKVGDDSALVVLQVAKPAATYVVGLARTGQFTTATSLRLDQPVRPSTRTSSAGLLADAVNRLCALPEGGACAPMSPKVTDAPAFPVGTSASLLSEIDLPTIGKTGAKGVGRLVGTTPREVVGDRSDANVLGCDVIHLVQDYDGTAISSNLIRSFVFVNSKLPKETGLTEVVGSLPRRRAVGFADKMAHQVERCPALDASLGTKVDSLAKEHTRTIDLRAWRMSTELPGNRSVTYNVAVVRNGGALAQMIYVSAPKARMADRDFVALSKRALERLAELPAYRAPKKG
ncbi:SigE family RNA polymerase sigma factor [Nocardioides montaniterrae]